MSCARKISYVPHYDFTAPEEVIACDIEIDDWLDWYEEDLIPALAGEKDLSEVRDLKPKSHYEHLRCYKLLREATKS